MSINKSIILNTDSYKASHFLQYPEGTQYVFSYIEARGCDIGYDKTVFFGLQAFLKEYLEGVRVTKEDIDFAERVILAHGEPFNREGWEYILNVHGGKLPVSIWAPKEGSVIPLQHVLLGIMNNDPNVPWLTSYLETSLLRAIWYPTTVATLSWHIKKDIKKFFLETSDAPLSDVLFKLHDFGGRGASSLESASLGGMAHLINFRGTDTISGLLAAAHYYGPSDEMMAWSIPASEHSTMTILGREGELQQMERMLDQFGGEGKLVACVSDSYDINNAIRLWGTVLKQKILDKKMTLVVRPDSGDPVSMSLNVIHSLDAYFGSTVNSKGFRVLNPAVRVIYGDGINMNSIHRILFNLKMHGYSADNIAFGMGGALLQHSTRDDLKFAMKASCALINDIEHLVYKDPVGDSTKKSKKGIISLFRNRLTGEFATFVNSDKIDSEWEKMSELVFANGDILRTQTFDEVRKLAE